MQQRLKSLASPSSGAQYGPQTGLGAVFSQEPPRRSESWMKTLLGMLNVGADRVAAFSDEDLDVLRDVADRLGVALQQARLREQLQRYTEELE